MTLLTAMGLASVAFVAVFTARAYRDNTEGNGQSRRSAIIEAWVNILIGFTINYGMNLALLPLVGAHLSLSENFMLGWVFTAAVPAPGRPSPTADAGAASARPLATRGPAAGGDPAP